MTEPAFALTKKGIETKLKSGPPLLNERVVIYAFSEMYSGQFRLACEVIHKCGLTAEVVAEHEKNVVLYAARRRNRNKHD